MSRTRTRRRATVAVAALLTIGGSLLAAPSSQAHPCVGVTVTGSTVVGGCHTPPVTGHALCPYAGHGNSLVVVCTP
jgi:hypothetical protein